MSENKFFESKEEAISVISVLALILFGGLLLGIGIGKYSAKPDPVVYPNDSPCGKVGALVHGVKPLVCLMAEEHAVYMYSSAMSDIIIQCRQDERGVFYLDKSNMSSIICVKSDKINKDLDEAAIK